MGVWLCKSNGAAWGGLQASQLIKEVGMMGGVGNLQQGKQ